MRRDAGRHADGDARAAVQQQEGKLGRKNGGFLLGPIEVRRKINRVLTNLLKHCLMGDGCQTGFCVPHRRRWVVVHRAEIAVTIEQGMTAGERLNKPDQGVIYRLITVGVVLAQNITNDSGAFAVWTVWGQP